LYENENIGLLHCAFFHTSAYRSSACALAMLSQQNN